MDGNTPSSSYSEWLYVPSWPEVLRDLISHGMNSMHERPLHPLQIKPKTPFIHYLGLRYVLSFFAALVPTQDEGSTATIGIVGLPTAHLLLSCIQTQPILSHR